MLNEHFGSSSFAHQYDSHHIIEDQIINNISLPNYEWQTLLSYDHWPTLFSFYNISYDNRYLTIMPSIYLPIISENQPLDQTTKASYYKVSLYMSFCTEIEPIPEISRSNLFKNCCFMKYLYIFVVNTSAIT